MTDCISLYVICLYWRIYVCMYHLEHTVCTVKKVSGFPVPSRDVTYQTLPGREILLLFPPGESLVSDILPGDGKTANLFLQCVYCISL